MNYYRRYCGDYAADTPHLTMLEHGAYTLLLDAYYTSEKPLPDSFDLLYRICRAQTAAEKKAVRNVAEQFFPSDGEFRHNGRADKELSIAVPKLERLRAVARVNGAKNQGRRKPNPDPQQEPNPVPKLAPERQPVRNPSLEQPPTASHQPEPQNPPPEERFPGGGGTADSAATFGAAALKAIPPPGPEVDVRNANATPAGLLAAVCQRNGIQANAFHPLVVEWARNGVNVEQLKAAIATARDPSRKGDGRIPLAYLDPILHDASRPKALPWKSDDNAAEQLCRDLGIKGAKIGEPREVWHRRIETALAEQNRAKVA